MTVGSPLPPPKGTRVAVVGTGAMGRHHVRILASSPEAELVGIYDQRPEVAETLAAEHGTTRFEDLDELLGGVEAAVLAVPTTDHAELACRMLERGLHVLVEKPIASNLDEADRMVAAAAKAGRVLGVGHVEFYNPAVRALLEHDDRARYVEVQRLSPFSPRSLDVDVLRDLMIHDLQLLHAMDSSPLLKVEAVGIEVLSPQVDMANARLEFGSGLVANVTASRVSAEPARNLRVFMHECYVSIDYREQEIKAARLGYDARGPRILPLELPVTKGEPLKAELAAFLATCRGEDVSFVDGAGGRQALETALRVGQAIAEG